MPDPSRLEKLDSWMQQDPFPPRFLPFFAWLIGMLLTGLAADHIHPWALPPVYTLQVIVVVALLWRYRKLTPELNLRFHWTVVPSALFLTAAWMLMGWWMAGELGPRWDALMQGQFLPRFDEAAFASHSLEPNRFSTTEPGDFEQMQAEDPALFFSAMALRLIGMAAVVPFFEELFVRSLCLRACARVKQTGLGLLQILEDLPVIGDWLADSPLTKPAAGKPPQFREQFEQNTLANVTLFGTIMSTIIFTASHLPRDWPGCVACGLVWCCMVWLTNKPSRPEARRLGLGPVIWSHGLVNALLWAHAWASGDWQFL